MSLNLEKMEKSLDKALKKETKQSLEIWLADQRNPKEDGKRRTKIIKTEKKGT